MGRGIDIKGQKFGRLTALESTDSRYFGQVVWRCRCDCGRITFVGAPFLRSKNIQSCGCGRMDALLARLETHRMSGSREYQSWNHMVQRCTNRNNDSYADYGGRGISVCERWLKFDKFYEDMGKRPKGKSLDRINNDGNYEPGNCRWATRKQQLENRYRVIKRSDLNDAVRAILSEIDQSQPVYGLSGC